MTERDRCPDCGRPVEPYLYAGSLRWKHVDGLPHGHDAMPTVDWEGLLDA